MSDPLIWLKDGYTQTMIELGAAESTALNQEADYLLEQWNAPTREFHGLNHLRRILDFLENMSDSVHQPLLLQIAAWYHGLYICTPENEHHRLEDYFAGAERAKHKLPELGLSDKQATRVADLILSLNDISTPSDDNDEIIFQDATLSYLGEAPQNYRECRKLLRIEMSCLDDLTYARFRCGFISDLLEQDQIFKSSYGTEHEETARNNLESELSKLQRAILEREDDSIASPAPIFAETKEIPTVTDTELEQQPNVSTDTPALPEDEHISSMEMVEDILDTLPTKKD